MTSKKRKLKYIREKNHYRKGGKAGSHFKITNELIEDVDFVENEIMNHSRRTINSLNKKFKMKFKVCEVSKGIIGDDLTTIQYYFKTINYD